MSPPLEIIAVLQRRGKAMSEGTSVLLATIFETEARTRFWLDIINQAEAMWLLERLRPLLPLDADLEEVAEILWFEKQRRDRRAA